MPWSAQNEIRWVPTSPLVVSPQMKNVPKSSQKSPLRLARTSPSIAARNGLARRGGSEAVPGAAPYGVRPISEGRSGRSQATSGIRAATAQATVSTTGRQPPACAIAASPGRKIRVPVAVLAVRSPMNRPRRTANQRFTTVAPSTMATQPLPRPDSTPQVAIRCQGSLIRALKAVEVAMSASAQSSVRRMPKLCIRAAAKGPTSP